MSAPVIHVETTIEGEIPARQLREMSRASHREAGEHWQRSMLPKHFQSGAAKRYGYKRRSPKYVKSKPNRPGVKKGGRVPLVLTGLTELLMRRRQIVKAFPTRATLDIPGPRYVAMRRKDPRLPNLGEEITAVDQRDETELTALYDRRLTDLMNNYSGRRSNRS